MMIKQIFKMIWNQRRLNGWIWMELLVVFSGTVVPGRYVCGTVVFLYPSDGI